MKSAVLEGRRSVRVVERPRPVPGEGEVLLRVRYCGICGTDVRAYDHGRHIPPGTVPGHEICGEVVERGAAVRGHPVGERVAVNPMPPCGACEHCRRGELTLCAEAVRHEIGFWPDHDGGLAELLLIQHPEEMLIPLPDEVSFEQAALVEPLACALRAVKRSQHLLGETALVLGAGMIGLGVVAFLRAAGAGLVVAVDRSARKLALARRLGADVALVAGDDEELLARVRELTSGRGPDRVFECAGTPAAFRLAPRLARKGGQVVLVGFCDGEVPFDPLTLVMREVELRPVLGYHAEDFGEAVRFLARRPFEARDLITDIVPLADAEARGLRRVLEDPECIRVLVAPGA